jgi:hypothetical protein
MKSKVEKKEKDKYLLSISKKDLNESEMIFGYVLNKKELRDLYLQLRDIFSNNEKN